MFDVPGKLALLPHAPSQVLALQRELIEAWRGRLEALDGCPPRELIEAERRVRVQLPGPLKEALSLYGQREDLLGLQDPLLAPGELWVDNGKILVFQEENQRCALWGVAVERVCEPDPPVIYKDLNALNDEPWRHYQDRLSVHLLESALNEIMLSSENAMFREIDSVAMGLVFASLKRIDIPDHVFWPNPEGASVKWFAGSGILVRVDGDAMIWACALSAQCLGRVLELIPGEWQKADF
jgi:hypothetical protein